MSQRQHAHPAAAPAPGAYSEHGTGSAYSSSANPDEEWTKISDLAERRRVQNRIAQRSYRKKLKRRLEDLERRAGQRETLTAENPVTASRPPRTQDFWIVIICALPVEYAAVVLIFDEFWPKDEYPQLHPPGGGSGYIQTGRIGNHNAVLCLLPNRGNASAAITVARLISTYTGLRQAILTGICSGVPSPGTDDEVLLGDVVISKSIAPYYTDRRSLGGPSHNHAVQDVAGRPDRATHTILAMTNSHFLADLRVRTFKMFEQLRQTAVGLGRPTYYHRPAADEDVLFETGYPHRHRERSDCSCSEGVACAEAGRASCTELRCDMRRQVLRKRLGSGAKQPSGGTGTIASTPESRIHVGRIASGDEIKSSELRDGFARGRDIIAFETEGTGVREKIPCIIIKGVCDYADGHKSDEVWRDFAAAMAASTVRAFLQDYEHATTPKTTRPRHAVPWRANDGGPGRPGVDAAESARSTEAADNCPGDNDDVRSLVSGPEDIRSQDGSGAVRWAVTTAAVSYLAEVLTGDPDLTTLYLDAARRLEDGRFIRNHGRLLKRYYLSLRSQTPNQKQTTAIEFLRPRSHRTLISRRVLEKLRSRNETKRERVHAALPQDEERNLTLERYLNGVEAGSRGPPADDAVGPAPDPDEDGSSVDEEDYRGVGALVDLEEARSFFVSGTPMALFKAEFRDFLDPGRDRAGETPRAERAGPPERPKVPRWGAGLSAWLFDLWSPPKPGNQRIRYTCECGDNMFLDVRELSPGGIGRFRKRMARDGLASLAAAAGGSTTDVPGGLSPPPPAHLRPERSSSAASLQSSEVESSSSSATRSSASSASSWSEEQAPQEEPSGFQYLLVCVNQKSLPMLVHIECSSFENDQYLCREILDNYRMIRDGATWKASFLVPSSVAAMMDGVSKFLEQRIPGWLQWIPRLSRSLSDISLFKMDTGDFVRFQLVPVGEAVVPNHFKCGEYPPTSEVKAGNYLYEPVPMVDVALASIPLWHLTRPGRHSDRYWITTFPKKLRLPLRREAGVYGKPVIGWGIRVNERFNWSQFLFLVLAVIVIIGAVMGAYLALKADDSSGFGLGAFLAAVAAIYIPHQYFAWKERLD